MKKIIVVLLLIFITDFGIRARQNPVPDKHGFIVRVGQMAPDFTIRYADGSKTFDLKDLRGKIVLLQFTASWCSVCRKEMPHLEKLWQENKDKNFVMIGIDLKESPQQTLEFAHTMKISYPLALDPDGSIFYSYAAHNTGVTRNVIIDKTGKIVYLTRLYNKDIFAGMADKINELLKTK